MTSPADQEALAADRHSGDFRVGLPARDAALSLLDAVLGQGQSLDAAFAAQIRHGALSSLVERDRALARAITATTLRRLGQLDDLLGQLIDRPLPKAAGRLKNILRAALAQILFMETPAHAVVNLAVHQAKSDRRTSRFDKLVNALLRRAGREGEKRIAGQDADCLNTPAWIWARWTENFGEETARAIAQSHLREAALDLSTKNDAQDWAKRLGAVLLPTGSLRLAHKGRIEKLEGFDEGAWWVQDAAAALPAILLGDVAGKRVADLCAAPGGKTAQLASSGAQVTALDISEGRLKRLKQNLERLDLEATCIPGDATNWRPDEPLDAVLLDAPCLATGTIRRHPDIPHLKSSEDLANLANLQSRLLAHAVTLVKPGGTVIYCTCSLEPEECGDQISALLAAEPAVRVAPIRADELAGQSGWLTDEGYLRTMPFHLAGLDGGLDGIDGFFTARLVVG